MLSLIDLGFTPQQAFELISDPLIGLAQTEEDAGEGIFDASDRIEGGDVITWWNDIEKDKRYKSWPNTLQGVCMIYATLDEKIWLIFVANEAFVSRSTTHHSSEHVECHLGIRPFSSYFTRNHHFVCRYYDSTRRPYQIWYCSDVQPRC